MDFRILNYGHKHITNILVSKKVRGNPNNQYQTSIAQTIKDFSHLNAAFLENVFKNMKIATIFLRGHIFGCTYKTNGTFYGTDMKVGSN